jgi:hypothetical protein
MGTPKQGFNHLSEGTALNYPSTVIWPRTVSHSKDWEPDIETPCVQLLLSMSSPVGTDACSNRDTSRAPWCHMNKICPNKHRQDGGRCRTYRQQPQRAHHQRLLQTRWRPLPDLLAETPRGPPSTSSSNSVVAATGPTGSNP